MSEFDSTPSSGPTRIAARNAGDVVALVPYLLGFHPESSIVVLGLRATTVDFATRMDLPEGDLPRDVLRHLASILAEMVARQGGDAAVVIGYGAASQVDPLLDFVGSALAGRHVELIERVRVTDGRYYTVHCDDPRCCPAAGTELPIHGVAVAQAVFAGHTALPNRAAFAAQLAAESGQARQVMLDALGSAAASLLAMVEAPTTVPAEGTAGSAAEDAIREMGYQAVREALRRYEHGGRLDDDEAARLLLLLQRTDVLVAAWKRSRPRDAHQRLWTDLTRRAPEDLLPEPACLLAFTAWRCGSGALARVALDRALAANPDHDAARIMSQLLDSGVSPTTWVDGEPGDGDPNPEHGST
ncbi:DUF4192 domain-containing protein [Phytohabitans houttuyneae]|uniref:DUF4192 domain-containing protein n=1 Tax=Phytohabitans houttuyneae TaxID=1076126 RepID=A0A6V8JXH1_9ACTN|nr:DUF4192 domain-containing protein [Phytohabitans houttuyneae]GFJ77453.1 hypothetical protein Phou_016330 [Phytohabitans houttuyneae]